MLVAYGCCVRADCFSVLIVVVLVVYVLCWLVILVFVRVAFFGCFSCWFATSALVFCGFVGLCWLRFLGVWVDVYCCVNSVGHVRSLAFLLVLCFKVGLLALLLVDLLSI